MYKNLLFISVLLTTLVQSLIANDLPVKKQDVSPQQLEKQNKEILILAAKAESKGLPQVINKYTTIVSIEAVGVSMVYTFEINTGSKSDDAIINEDHSKMERIITEGICTSSKRFMDAQITKTYIYKSAISKKKLFQFDVNQAVCFKIYGSKYGEN